ncbi:MAG: hypothetical protein ABSG11_14855 [Candidatus Korobacteraceae bacterium]|jgi:hypothetical protein
MGSRSLGLIAILLVVTSLAYPQARSLVTSSTPPVQLPTTANDQVVLGSVSLGRPRTFSLFNIQAAGTISPDPDLNGAAFQLQFLVCDQPDCTGDIKSDTRILQDSDSATPSQLIATRSFGVSTHNVRPVVLSDLQPRNSSGTLYLAVALKLLHSSNAKPFAGRLNLLRVDVMP